MDSEVMKEVIGVQWIVVIRVDLVRKWVYNNSITHLCAERIAMNICGAVEVIIAFHCVQWRAAASTASIPAGRDKATEHQRKVRAKIVKWPNLSFGFSVISCLLLV